ncbi:hypothetical protein [Melittangium boletus]|uniref:Lipoprotein n=1 Tax=Melittangium boletus DSM 14713 TaxID=1294270 RepID=A0A250IQH8_9BACT|nr:hypothetical protein [Melittangium boletus]ATB33538.1 hypothetical protein MEBOL_007036 [Melittangium boletus DSM 14713]
MREALRWLFVVAGMSWSWAASAGAPQRPTPVDCGSAQCEGIREMRALFNAEMAYLQERDLYSSDLAAIGFAPPACANGSRVPVPGPGWVAGCRFAYRVTQVTKSPESLSFTAIAQGGTGTEAEGTLLQFSQTFPGALVFWVQRDGVRRYVGLDECLPAESFTCSAQMREGMQNIRALFTSERAFLQEKDRYSSNFQELGFLPLGCTDPTSPALPDGTWIGGCRFIYHVDLKSNPMGFTLTARAVSGSIQGTTIKMEDSGALTVTPVPFSECF